ncbi:riboflavin transporter MCH5 [Colletotrichum paranaense]|uniref:Riboflavin transporter MCH5 n=1 Tax=Colletotrichum paranaense TaxID=1914294 RepID=A0ABQ9S7A5_9PEZI|nr:riboflavin transporter MCH5 [Colletotrichum paranaense]KAK1527830.1 riboflavin transporter MCH5 [Colletotrichum paranaense]
MSQTAVKTSSIQLRNIRGPIASSPSTDFHDDEERSRSRDRSCYVERDAASLNELTFPEGGWQAWLVVFGSFCAMLSVFGLINSAAVFESYFSENQLADHSSSEIGWIFSLYLFIVFFIGIQVGPLFDQYGPRGLVVAGGLCMSASLLLLSLCKGLPLLTAKLVIFPNGCHTEYYQILLAYSILGGLGGALLNSPSYGAIAHFFDSRRGFATGIAATAGSIGGIVYPILLQNLFPTLGFGPTARILGFILLGLTVPATLFIRSRLPKKEGPGSIWPDFTVFKNLKFTLSAVGIFFMEWGLFVPITYIISYAATLPGSNVHSYTILSILNATSAVGRFLPGLAADKYGRFNVILITIALCFITVLGLWLPSGNSQPMLLAFVAIFGFASGSNLGLVPVCLGQLCDAREYGRYLSTAMMMASFGTLSSLPIAGAILEAKEGGQNWKGLILFSGVSYFLAFICYAAVRVFAVGWKISARF